MWTGRVPAERACGGGRACARVRGRREGVRGRVGARVGGAGGRAGVGVSWALVVGCVRAPGGVGREWGVVSVGYSERCDVSGGRDVKSVVRFGIDGVGRERRGVGG